MDGYLKIKTKIDNSGVDKDISQLEEKINVLENRNVSNRKEEQILQKQINKYEELISKADEYKNEISQLQTFKNGTVVASNQSEMAKLQMDLMNANQEISKQATGINKVYIKLSKVKQKQLENNQKIAEYKEKIESIKADRIKDSIGGIGNRIKSQISQISKMVLAVFSIRTAWNAVNRVVSAVKEYNSQVSADFEYMRYCIANALAPAVQWLVKIAYTLLSYINAISVAWFGINLFANSSAKSFQKMKDNASGTAKSAKEIQKSLQGFDEMNIVQDNTNNSAASLSTNMPSMDLSNINTKKPEWLQWIIDHKDEIIAFFTMLGITIGAMKIATFLSQFEALNTVLEKLGKGTLNILKKITAIQAVGIVVIIAGIVALIEDLIAMIKDPSWAKFGEILFDISVILAGIALLMGNWTIAIVALVVGITGLCVQLFKQQGAILSVKDAQEKLKEATQNLEEANNTYINSVDRAENTLQTLKEAEEKAGISGEELNKQVEQGILDYQNMTKEQKEVYKAYLDNQKAQQELKEATEALAEAKKKEKIASWENKLATMAETGQYDKYKQSVVEAFKNGELSAEEARDLIGKSMSGMSRDSQKTFMEDLPEDIKNGLDPKNYETAGQKILKWFGELWKKVKSKFSEIATTIGNTIENVFKSAVNLIINFAENKINQFINAINSAISLINAIPGVNINKLSTINIPRLAKGGVIAQPTQAIIGETGTEAVMPLENNLEWLDILADKLASRIGTGGGSYIIQMDGRVIQRGMAKRQQELVFAKNGR